VEDGDKEDGEEGVMKKELLMGEQQK